MASLEERGTKTVLCTVVAEAYKPCKDHKLVCPNAVPTWKNHPNLRKNVVQLH